MANRVQEVDETKPQLDATAAANSPLLLAAFAAAGQMWPGVALTIEAFTRHLSSLRCIERLPGNINELYLCAACTLGQRKGLELLEAEYFPALTVRLRRMLREEHLADEVLQTVRIRLLTGLSPKIASYRGEGSLAGWLGVVSAHAAQDFLRRRNMQRKHMNELMMGLATGQVAGKDRMSPSPEELALNDERVRACDSALRSAMGSLDAGDQHLLREHFLFGASINELAPHYTSSSTGVEVHRSTVARRIQRSARRVRNRVRTRLSAHYAELSVQDLDSLVLDACSRWTSDGASPAGVVDRESRSLTDRRSCP